MDSKVELIKKSLKVLVSCYIFSVISYQLSVINALISRIGKANIFIWQTIDEHGLRFLALSVFKLARHKCHSTAISIWFDVIQKEKLWWQCAKFWKRIGAKSRRLWAANEAFGAIYGGAKYKKKHQICRQKIADLLRELSYSLQGNQKGGEFSFLS